MPDADAGALATETLAIETWVNGVRHRLEIDTGETLAALLRDRLGLTGTKVSCGVQVCGACTVLLDGLAVSACSVLAVEADGHAVRTVEGMARDGELAPLQDAFIACGAFQCGFCTPGFLMACTELLERHADPDEDTIRSWLEGNLCRCTGYRPIVEAVRMAAKRRTGASGPDGGGHDVPATGSTGHDVPTTGSAGDG
ncbi:MAG: (2Fe-2S)-binding protein [Chloroflexi bacterium]|nr:(2Fe-2S)-binding protein [Chloroflexota bacterium]